jgi:hypothetical protein
MQMVAVAIAKATWNWVRGKCEEAMREVLGAGRGEVEIEIEIRLALTGDGSRGGKRDAAGSSERRGERQMRRVTRCNTTY